MNDRKLLKQCTSHKFQDWRWKDNTIIQTDNVEEKAKEQAVCES